MCRFEQRGTAALTPYLGDRSPFATRLTITILSWSMVGSSALWLYSGPLLCAPPIFNSVLCSLLLPLLKHHFAISLYFRDNTLAIEARTKANMAVAAMCHVLCHATQPDIFKNM